jgi:polysaccharide biosynthesis protein PslH
MQSSRLPKILYLVHRVPFPPNRGDRIRSFHLLRFLSARAEVHLACLTDEAVPDENLAALRGWCARLAVVPIESRLRWVRAVMSAGRGRTATEGLFHSPRLRGIVQSWARETRFDAVVVFCSSMAQYLDLAELAGVPTVIDLVDVDSQKWFDYAVGASGPKKWLYGLEGRRLRRLERSLGRRADALTLVSEPETDLYRAFCPDARVHAVANGVDLDFFRPMEPDDSGTSRECVFVGAMDYRANVEGIRWFAANVWPRVRQLCPEAALTLVGRRPTPAIQRLAELPGIHLAGDVPDVRPYLSRAALAVAPLHVARGIQNKVLEAAAMGKASVVSPQALEGLDFESGVHLQVAATADQWVASIVQLLGDPVSRRRLGEAARARVKSHYRWETRLQPFEALMRLPTEARPFERVEKVTENDQPAPSAA